MHRLKQKELRIKHCTKNTRPLDKYRLELPVSISAEKLCLERGWTSQPWRNTGSSVAVLAELPLRSPQKIFLFTIEKYIDGIKIYPKKTILIFKKTSLTGSPWVILFYRMYCSGQPENYWFSLSKTYFQDESIQKMYYLILKTKSLVYCLATRLIVSFSSWLSQVDRYLSTSALALVDV